MDEVPTIESLPDDVMKIIFWDHLWEYMPVARHVCAKWNELYENGADSGFAINHGPRSCRFIALDNYLDVLKWAHSSLGLFRKPNVNITLLGVSASEGHHEMTKYLLEVLQKRPSIINKWGNASSSGTEDLPQFKQVDHVEMALQLCAGNGHVDLFEHIMNAYERTPTKEQLIAAARKDCGTIVDICLNGAPFGAGGVFDIIGSPLGEISPELFERLLNTLFTDQRNRDYYRRQAVYGAVEAGNLKLVFHLRRTVEDFNVAGYDDDFWAYLTMIAIERNSCEMLIFAAEQAFLPNERKQTLVLRASTNSTLGMLVKLHDIWPESFTEQIVDQLFARSLYSNTITPFTLLSQWYPGRVEHALSQVRLDFVHPYGKEVVKKLGLCTNRVQ